MEQTTEIQKPASNTDVRTECGKEWWGCVDHIEKLKSHWYAVADDTIRVFPPTEYCPTWVVMIRDKDFQKRWDLDTQTEAFQFAASLVGGK